MAPLPPLLIDNALSPIAILWLPGVMFVAKLVFPKIKLLIPKPLPILILFIKASPVELKEPAI